MNAIISPRRFLTVLAAASFAVVFGAVYLLERGNPGIDRFYLAPIALAAFAGGTWFGGFAGLVATGLYAVAIVYSPRIPTAGMPALQTGLRGVTFVLMGLLIGWLAAAARKHQHELTILAQRDRLTGLSNTRAFEAAIRRHLASQSHFLLLLARVEEPAAIDGTTERKLRTVSGALSGAACPNDELARIGDYEFAVLRMTNDSKEVAEHFERVLLGAGMTATLGWASHPQDGEDPISLYRAANDRLSARQIFRGHA